MALKGVEQNMPNGVRVGLSSLTTGSSIKVNEFTRTKKDTEKIATDITDRLGHVVYAKKDKHPFLVVHNMLIEHGCKARACRKLYRWQYYGYPGETPWVK